MPLWGMNPHLTTGLFTQTWNEPNKSVQFHYSFIAGPPKCWFWHWVCSLPWYDGPLHQSQHRTPAGPAVRGCTPPPRPTRPGFRPVTRRHTHRGRAGVLRKWSQQLEWWKWRRYGWASGLKTRPGHLGVHSDTSRPLLAWRVSSVAACVWAAVLVYVNTVNVLQDCNKPTKASYRALWGPHLLTTKPSSCKLRLDPGTTAQILNPLDQILVFESQGSGRSCLQKEENCDCGQGCLVQATIATDKHKQYVAALFQQHHSDQRAVLKSNIQSLYVHANKGSRFLLHHCAHYWISHKRLKRQDKKYKERKALLILIESLVINDFPKVLNSREVCEYFKFHI